MTDEPGPLDAPGPSDEALAEATFVPLEVLGARLSAVGGDAPAPISERARTLARIEGELLVTLPVLAKLDPEFDGIRGSPTLADASRWRDEAASWGVETDGAQRLVDDLTIDEVTAFAKRIEVSQPSANADACFEDLVEVTMLERDALRRGAQGVDFGSLRVRTRAAFVNALRDDPPTEAMLDHWATELLDGADVVLTGIDDVDALDAARQLERGADDLDWYLRKVDQTGRWLRVRVKRKRARLRAEYQERQLQARLEAKFGVQRVARFERVIVALIFFVLGALLADALLDLSEPVRLTLLALDTLACLAFLWEFFVKLWMVGPSKLRWFARHFLIDFIPSLPFGLVFIGELQSVRAGRALRFFRMFRVAKYLRWMLPILRLARGFGFLARGIDRLVRRYGNLLNRNVILFPNREERREALKEQHSVMVEARRVRAAVGREWRDLLATASEAERPDVVEVRVAGLQDARRAGHTKRPAEESRRGPLSDLPADAFIDQLAAMNSQELQADMGPDFIARSARIVRIFARVPIRWFPIIRRYVPRIAARMDDADVVCAASHSIAREMKRHHDRWFWCADLYGTVTPSEFVDRVGTAMVKASTRPAQRLVMFGGLYLLFRMVLTLGQSEVLDQISRFVGTVIGIPLYVLGGVCIVLLGLGWWMKRIAGEATFFFDQTAKAQFLALTETFKGRHLARDVALLDRRVIEPEELVQGVVHPDGADARRAEVEAVVRRWLVEAQVGERAGRFELMERVILLYRDGLDGALFGESDTRTTSQLLGNPALRQLRSLSDRIDRKERKALRALDLEGGRFSLRGPYIWFSYISKAVAQAAARLIVEYNRHAIPIDELRFSTDADRKSYESWVDAASPLPADVERRVPTADLDYVTTAFTALHFLDDDAWRDRDVLERFGPAVLENLRTDRRLLFRTVFGTFPRHLRPKDRRVVNLYRVYESWFAGGRAFFIPLRVLWRGLKFFARFVEWLVGAIGEIRRPKPRHDPTTADEADFATALRKIDRMRGPVVWACLWLRARFDAEYLGIELPGSERAWPAGLTVEGDLHFLGADPAQRRQVAVEQGRGEGDVRRMSRLIDAGLFEDVAAVLGVPVGDIGPEHVRAAVAAYRADMSSIRTLLSCAEILRETAIVARRAPALPRRYLPQWGRRRAFGRWWRAHGRGGVASKRAAWRAVARNENESGIAVAVWDEQGPEAAREVGVRALADLLRHVGRITEQIVTLRTVQTLSLVDLLNYREHVYRLGSYAESGDSGGDALRMSDDQLIDRPPSTFSTTPVT